MLGCDCPPAGQVDVAWDRAQVSGEPADLDAAVVLSRLRSTLLAGCGLHDDEEVSAASMLAGDIRDAASDNPLTEVHADEVRCEVWLVTDSRRLAREWREEASAAEGFPLRSAECASQAEMYDAIAARAFDSLKELLMLEGLEPEDAEVAAVLMVGGAG